MTNPRSSCSFNSTIGCERGQGLSEYIIIAIIVAVLVIVALRYFGGSISGNIESATDQISTAGDETANPKGSGEGGQGAKPASGSGETPIEGSGGGKGGSSKRVTASNIEKQIEALKAPGIGDEEPIDISSIQFNWKTLGLFGLGVVGVGIGIVFVLAGDGKKGKRVKKKKKKKVFSRGNEDGQAMVEFTLCAITYLFVILGIIQLALILNAYTVVRYAAYNAARAAIVHGGSDDEKTLKEKMHEAARISLLPIFPRHGRADHVLGFAENYAGAVATDNTLPYFFATTALTIPVVFSAPITEVKILDNPNRSSSDVTTFDDPVDSDKALITVQVVHQYEMVIPLVNRMLFYVYNLYLRLKETGGAGGVVGLGGYSGQSVDFIAAETDRLRRNGYMRDLEYRIPLVAHYTMRMQSDLQMD